MTNRPDELARGFAGRIATDLGEIGATRLVVPDELVLAGQRGPLLDAVAAARKLGIPAQSASGHALNAKRVVRRRLR